MSSRLRGRVGAIHKFDSIYDKKVEYKDLD